MNADDKLMISLNGKENFDIDFESAYTQEGEQPKEDFFNYWHPCYKLNAETVSD